MREKSPFSVGNLTVGTASKWRLGVLAAAVRGPGSAAPPSERGGITLLRVGGMTCGGCSGRVERALNKVEGVASATVDLEAAQATVVGTAAAAALVAAVEAVGKSAEEMLGIMEVGLLRVGVGFVGIGMGFGNGWGRRWGPWSGDVAWYGLDEHQAEASSDVGARSVAHPTCVLAADST